MALIELEDTDWFPDVLRDQQLGYIGWLVVFLDMYRPISSLLPNWVNTSHLSQVYDLCSGAGEPIMSLAKFFSTEIDVKLSDKYPPLHVDENVSYISSPVDILNLNFDPETYYTMFNAFHHFSTTEQRTLVARMADSKAPFCFVEILEPSAFTLVKVVIANTIGQILLAPLVRPFSLKRLLFTYLLPVNLITTTYDGIISVLKSKTKSQYQTLLSDTSWDDYNIEVEIYRAPYTNRLIVIRGFPTRSTAL